VPFREHVSGPEPGDPASDDGYPHNRYSRNCEDWLT
jgi:hypothetical protein